MHSVHVHVCYDCLHMYICLRNHKKFVSIYSRYIATYVMSLYNRLLETLYVRMYVCISTAWFLLVQYESQFCIVNAWYCTTYICTYSYVARNISIRSYLSIYVYSSYDRIHILHYFINYMCIAM